MRDGVARKVVRYPCQVAGVKGAPGIRVAEGSAEHYEQSERAKQMAWRHVELALKGDQPDSVDGRVSSPEAASIGTMVIRGVIMNSSCTRPQGHSLSRDLSYGGRHVTRLRTPTPFATMRPRSE